MVEVTDFRYTEDLILRRRVDGNGRLFYVDANYRVTFRLDGEQQNFTVLAGFATDLASIPSVVPKWVAQKVDRHVEAAVVHDALYVAAMWDKATADAIFLAAMVTAGVPAFRRAFMYRSVRWFGRGSYP